MLALASGCGPLAEWLSTHSTGIGDRVTLTGNHAVASATAECGETMFELAAGACLTSRVAFADREMGRELQSMAARVGPGFDTVALATLMAVERVRGFEAESWYAGSAAEKVGVEPARRASAWSPLTSAHWEAEMHQPSDIDAELLPLVQQGMELVMPLVELAARRAWVPGAAPSPPAAFLSDAWVRMATDDRAGWSRTELEQVLTASFGLVLSRQWVTPPQHLVAGGCGVVLSDEPAQRWGFGEGAPQGPALLPPLEGLLDAQSGGGGGGGGNVVVGVPPLPTAGNLGEGVSVRCVATRRIEPGERLVAS